MTEEKLDETYSASKKFAEKKPYPTPRASSSRLKTSPRSRARRRALKPKSPNITLLKEIDQGRFIDKL